MYKYLVILGLHDANFSIMFDIIVQKIKTIIFADVEKVLGIPK